MEKRLTMVLACLFLMMGVAFAQTKVTGTVIAQEDGEPVIGASVVIDGLNKGVVTDVDGKFTISVPAGKRLQVSYIGMKTQLVKPKAGMRIVLEPDATTLQDVVVTGMVKVDGNIKFLETFV